MVFRILMLLLAFVIMINLVILTACSITGQNLYQKYGKQMMYIFGEFIFIIAAMYIALALIGLK